MKCPNCSKPFFFVTENKGNKCLCKKCGHSGDFVQPTYGEYHETKYEKTILRTPETDPLLAQFLPLLQLKSSDVVLDYGCGRGDYIAAMKPFVKEAVGADINIEVAAKRFPEVSFHKLSEIRTPFADATFDKIVTVNTIEHIHDFEGFLVELKRILKPGGLLFITTYDTEFVLHNILFDNTHVIEWTKSEYEAVIAKYFKVEQGFRSGSFFNYHPWNKLITKVLKPELCALACNA